MADAFRVGRKAGKLAPSLKTEFDAPERRLGKRKQRVSEDDWDAAAKEEVKMRMAPVKLDFPSALAPAIATPAPSSAAAEVIPAQISHVAHPIQPVGHIGGG